MSINKRLYDSYKLITLLNRFNNSIQAKGNTKVEDMSWKQFILIIAINRFDYPPTINDLSAINGTSHQNTKQLLLKLEETGLVQIIEDKEDRRKQRVILTYKEKGRQAGYKDQNINLINKLFESITEEELQTTLNTLTKLDKAVEGIN